MPALKILFFCGFFPLAGAFGAQAQSGQSLSSYPASFFVEARPNTAADMISRLPGFSLNTGTGASARGFSGSAGNILVDGSRPTAKTDDLNTILQRIPASEVARIDVIRGGAPGIDMQGQSVVANIVRRTDAPGQIIAIARNILIEDGEWVPNGSLEYHGQSGVLRYQAALARTASIWDDSPGFGYRRITIPGGAPGQDEARRLGIMQLGWSAHGEMIAPLLGGEWSSNLTLQTTDYTSSQLYAGYGGSRFDSITRKRNGEFGSHWQKTLGDFNLETLILQRLGGETDINTSAKPGDSAIFLGNKNSGESIARATLRYAVSPRLNLETGGEGAYNFLNGRSSYADNGAAIALPNANVAVDEKRGEIFANTSWKITPDLSLEDGARLEYSVIAESGDTNRKRDFFYAKPRLLLAWAPDSLTQLRLRAERVVGQLNMADFVASSSLSTYGVAAGNADLRPDQRWQFEANLERHFWDKGALVLSVLHEDITDLEDYIPVGGGLDAPGNIPRTVSDKFTISGTIPLDRLGLKNGLLKPTFYWNESRLNDPVTGMARRISAQRDRNLTTEISQDVEAWNSTWLFGISPSFSNEVWRIAQISMVTIHNPYTYAYWIWHPTSSLSIKVEGDNIIPYRFEQELVNYAGPRGSAPLSSIQDVVSRTRPRLLIELRKTF